MYTGLAKVDPSGSGVRGDLLPSVVLRLYRSAGLSVTLYLRSITFGLFGSAYTVGRPVNPCAKNADIFQKSARLFFFRY